MADGRRLRGISGDMAIRAFLRAGGVLRTGKGDHANVKMPNGRVVTIPRRGDVKVGLLTAAIRTAGLTKQEFIKLL